MDGIDWGKARRNAGAGEVGAKKGSNIVTTPTDLRPASGIPCFLLDA